MGWVPGPLARASRERRLMSASVGGADYSPLDQQRSGGASDPVRARALIAAAERRAAFLGGRAHSFLQGVPLGSSRSGRRAPGSQGVDAGGVTAVNQTMAPRAPAAGANQTAGLQQLGPVSPSPRCASSPRRLPQKSALDRCDPAPGGVPPRLRHQRLFIAPRERWLPPARLRSSLAAAGRSYHDFLRSAAHRPPLPSLTPHHHRLGFLLLAPEETPPRFSCRLFGKRQ